MRKLLAAAAFSLPIYAQPAVGSRPFRLEELRTPPGYEVTVHARVPGSPRHMAFGPNGVLYVAARGRGEVVAVPEAGRAVTVLSRLNGPHSLAFHEGWLYVSVNDGVVRFANAVTEDLVIASEAERIVSLPVSGPNQHSTRSIGFGPDGLLYLTAGSTCNFCAETVPWRAAMMRYSADGKEEKLYARGLRNTVSFAWHPATGALWSVDNGGDRIGDTEPPEEINIIEEGGDYGWPDCIGARRGHNWGPQARPNRCGDTRPPAFEMPAHGAPLGIAFYQGGEFPFSFENDALVALHGSWNRNDPYGYKVIRVRAAAGTPSGSEDFLWGFFDAASRTRSGRPVHAIPGPDGAVYVSDDATGNIYRVAYVGPRINPGGVVRVTGNIYALYGRRLAVEGAPLRIAVDGMAAEALYAGEEQVNFAMPPGLEGEVRVRVENARGADEIALRIE